MSDPKPGINRGDLLYDPQPPTALEEMTEEEKEECVNREYEESDRKNDEDYHRDWDENYE